MRVHRLTILSLLLTAMLMSAAVAQKTVWLDELDMRQSTCG